MNNPYKYEDGKNPYAVLGISGYAWSVISYGRNHPMTDVSPVGIAKYLYEMFKDKLDISLLQEFNRKLKIGRRFNKYLR